MSTKRPYRADKRKEYDGQSLALIYNNSMKKCVLAVLSGVLLCGSPAGRAQDVAVPDAPNLDLEKMDTKELAAWKKSMVKFMVLMDIGKLLDNGRDLTTATVREKIAWQVDAMPMKMLTPCPEDFRAVIQEWVAASRNDEVNEKQHVLLHQRLNAVLDKYNIEETIEELCDWAIGRHMPEFNRCSRVGPNLSKRLNEIRQGVEAGTMKLPEL